MQIAHIDELPLETRSGTRGGQWRICKVFSGDPASPDNFLLQIYYPDGSFYSPRHRHNFDQFRYQIEGDADFDRNGKMAPGVLAYFPEGASYGPTSGPPHVVTVLQFGGPAGNGYMGSRGPGVLEEMSQFGSFSNGVFRRNEGDPGKKNQDSYEAIWEHVYGRPLVYPEPQYHAPVMMDTTAWPWKSWPEAPGVGCKSLGTFTSCGLKAACYRIEAGASLDVADRGIYLVVEGAGTVNSEAYRTRSAVYLDAGETSRFVADEPSEIVLMGMSAAEAMPRVAAPLETAAE